MDSFAQRGISLSSSAECQPLRTFRAPSAGRCADGDFFSIGRLLRQSRMTRPESLICRQARRSVPRLIRNSQKEHRHRILSCGCRSCASWEAQTKAQRLHLRRSPPSGQRSAFRPTRIIRLHKFKLPRLPSGADHAKRLPHRRCPQRRGCRISNMTITRQQALDSFHSPDLIGLGFEADAVRRRLHPEGVVT